MKILEQIFIQRLKVFLALLLNGFRSTKQKGWQFFTSFLLSIFLIGYLCNKFASDTNNLGLVVLILLLIFFSPNIVNFCRQYFGKKTLDIEELSTIDDDEEKDFPLHNQPWWYYLYFTGKFVLITTMLLEIVLVWGLFFYEFPQNCIQFVLGSVCIAEIDYIIIRDALRRQRERK